MKVWKVILATLVIFCAGVFAGIRAGKFCRHHQANGPADGNYAPQWGGNSSGTNFPFHGTNHDNRLASPFGLRQPFRGQGREFLERLDHHLKLDPEQRKQIEKILNESQKHTREVWKKIEPEMREEMKKTHQEIRKILTPDQAASFEELMKRPKQPREGQGTNNPTTPGPGEVPPLAPPPPGQ